MGHSVLACLGVSICSASGLLLPGSNYSDGEQPFQWGEVDPIYSSGCPKSWRMGSGSLRREILSQTRYLGLNFCPLEWSHSSPKPPRDVPELPQDHSKDPSDQECHTVCSHPTLIHVLRHFNNW